MNEPTPDHVLEKIKEALYAGRKIEAIKVYREARGVGLKEAKEDVEKLEAELRQRSPERFKAAAGQGCLGMVVALGLAVGAFLWLGWG